MIFFQPIILLVADKVVYFKLIALSTIFQLFQHHFHWTVTGTCDPLWEASENMILIRLIFIIHNPDQEMT